MVRLNRIYTRTGDAGETGLVDGSRLPKSAPRMAAIGDVDELNSAIGVALTHDLPEAARTMLGRIQNELFDLGADFATPGPDFAPSEMSLRILPSQVERLEAEIDAMNVELEPLRSFILPGGDPPGNDKNCRPSTQSDKDTNNGVSGWWFYLNFTATRATWSDN